MVDRGGFDRKRQALGRGLEALIPVAESQRKLFFCPIDAIDSSLDQPRSTVNPQTLSELAESIRQSGVLQPVLLRRDGERYQVVAGERRWRAAKMAGLDRIPALVKEMDEQERFVLALIENIQREDLTPLEEALAYRRLIDEHGYTQQTLAERVGKARSTIANALRLLDLPPTIQDHVASGRLTAGHARAVLSVAPERQTDFARDVLEKGLTVRQAEHQARPRPPRELASSNEPVPGGLQPTSRQPESPGAQERQANLAAIEARLRESLQTRVALVDRQGCGKIEIYYDNDETLQTVIDRLLGERGS
ncbi:MAG: ParB/RepB/Spo0J family partition protein [Bradymonadales bacterium]|nr:ParB/RepB/Spo0J family partition protein [Bradymonadales bacterium]